MRIQAKDRGWPSAWYAITPLAKEAEYLQHFRDSAVQSRSIVNQDSETYLSILSGVALFMTQAAHP